MKIEVWSDIACPFCYIGKRKLEAALDSFPQKEKVNVTFKSFQLDPDAPLYTGQDFYETMATKFGSLERAKQMTASVTKQAADIGLDFQFDKMKATNTFDAHRLTKYAETKGKALVITEALLQAHFTDGEDVGNIDSLVKIAQNTDLNTEEVRTLLEDKEAYAAEVDADIAEAKQFGISGVPYFIINRKYAISGAQPTTTFIQALEKVWEEEQEAPAFQDLSTTMDAACDDDGCALPNQGNK